MKKTNRIVASLLCGAVVTALPSALFGQNYFTPESGDWNDAANWNTGIPTTATNAEFGTFGGSFSGAQTVTIGAGQAAAVQRINVGNGRAVNIALQGGSSLTMSSIIALGANVGSGSGASTLRFTASDVSNLSTLNIGLIQIGVTANSSNGNALVFDGAGLRINTSSDTRIGTVKSGNSLTVSGGAHFNSTNLVRVGYIGAARTSSEDASNNSLLVDGAGTRMTILGTGNTLTVGSYNGGGDILPIIGNTATVSNGAFLRAQSSGANPAVLVGSNRYGRSNSVSVTGANSRMEIGGTRGLIIGSRDTNNYGNSLTVAAGGVVKNEGTTELYGLVSEDRNHITIGSGGSYIASDNITNRGGVIYLDQGGALVGESVDGSQSKAVTLLLQNNGGINNSIPALYVEGDGLGDTVSVRAETGTLISVGREDRSSVTSFELNSEIVMDAGSTLQFMIYSGSNAGSITFGSNGSLKGATTLAISFVGYTPNTVGEWVLFNGNTAGIDSDFSLTVQGLPTLGSDLSWDVSRLNQEGGWVLAVVPEPKAGGMALGVAALVLAFAAKRRLARKVA